MSTDRLRFEILGRLRAWRDDRELDLGPGKQRAVLAVLLIHANRPVPTASIVDAVWGDDPPDNGSNVVQKYIAGLRRVLDPDRSPRTPGELLTLSSAGYVLHVPADGLDAEVFQRHVRQVLAVREDGAGEAAAGLRAALAMWRGEALAGMPGAAFAAARDRLAEERAAAAESCAEIELELGRHAQLVPELIRLVDDFPLREKLRHLLMLALYRCGRQAEALAAYRNARSYFAEEFGVEPGEQLQQLHLSILRADPALAPRSAADPPPPGPPVSMPVPGPPPAPSSEPSSAPPPVPFSVPSAAPPTFPYGSRRPHWLIRVAAVLVPLVSFGLGTWAMTAYYAARRRSRLLAAAAAGYLVLTGLFLVIVMASDVDETSWLDGIGLFSVLLLMVGGAVQAGVLTAAPAVPAAPAVTQPAVVDGIERRARREQARVLVAHHPEIARELNIGRPDLPRSFDDGGLVDVNSAPEHVLATLPGVDSHLAKFIVSVREAQGPFASTEELILRGLLPAPVVRALHETLIALPS